MSDLAPFVASTLRDRVVLELMQENKNLREDLQKAKAVEVVSGTSGHVYAKALFDDGRYGGDLWQVDLNEASPESNQATLNALPDVEIHVGGGISRARFAGNNNCAGYLDADKKDGENQKLVRFCFGADSGALWLTLLVQNWPEESHRALAAQEEASRRTDDEFDLMEHLTNGIARAFPNATVSFLEVTFFADTVQRAIDALELDPSVEEQREEQRAEIALLRQVIGRMRDTGVEETGEAFLSRVFDVLVALETLGINDPGDLIDNVFAGLIELLEATGGGEEFVTAIQEMDWEDSND